MVWLAGEVWGGRWGAVGLRSPPDQPVAADIEWLWSFRRLWVAAISRHSESAAALPRRWKRSILRLYLVCPKTLDRLLALSVDRPPVLAGEHAAHVVIEPAGPPGSGFVLQARVRRDQHLRAIANDVLHLPLVPVAGVGDHDPRPVAHARPLQVAQRGVKDWLQVPEVRRLGRDLRRDDDLPVGDGGLRVIALDRGLSLGAHHPRVRVGQVDPPVGHRRQLVGRRGCKASPIAADRAGMTSLISLVSCLLHGVCFLQPALGLSQTLAA
jgi:hypothetical protein